MTSFADIDYFERELAEFAGAKFAVATDCCTHAIELAMRYDQVQKTSFSAYTYLSVIMIFHQLGIEYTLLDEKWDHQYRFHGTRIIDSARHLSDNMYQADTITCVSFGRGKPLDLHRGGALLLDDAEAYRRIQQARYDGRTLQILPWQHQKRFPMGFHYKLTPDEAVLGRIKLKNKEFTLDQANWSFYPDTREIEIFQDWIKGN